jgi:YHS domain-containing protein
MKHFAFRFVAIRLAVIALVAGAWYTMHPATDTAALPAPTPTAAPTETPSKPAADPKVAAKPYPFSTSVVSGEKLGGKDSIVKLVQDGYEVKLANAGEAATFNKNPAVYVAKIAAAYKTAKPCPLTVCPVMGDPLDATAYSFVYEGREFKFCCDGCMDDFEKDPTKFVKMWDEAEKAAATAK